MPAILTKEELKMLKGEVFPFENLVIEGGGAKVIAAVGTVKVLAELGILKQIKRFGGSSAGAMLSALLAIGYNIEEIEKVMDENLTKKIEDEWPGPIGWYSEYKNFKHGFGLHKGGTLRKWLGEVIAKKMDGNTDATFKQVYDKTGNELVITGSEVRMKDTVYFHVKTTSGMKVRDAVFMSMSFPVFIQPTALGNQLFIDGGAFCNYPLHCFDGWYLSMDEDNSFYNKWEELGHETFTSMHRDERRFGTRNKNTIGVLVYSQNEVEVFKKKFEERTHQYIHKPSCPSDPAVARACSKHRESTKNKLDTANLAMKHLQYTLTISNAHKKLVESDFASEDVISIFDGEKPQLDIHLSRDESDFTTDNAEVIFGGDFEYAKVFGPLDFKQDMVHLESAMKTKAYDQTNQLGLDYNAIADFFDKRVVLKHEGDARSLKEKGAAGYMTKIQEIRTDDYMYDVPPIKTVSQFLSGVLDAFDIQLKMLHLKDKLDNEDEAGDNMDSVDDNKGSVDDFHRSIGINTLDTETNDYDMEADKRKNVKQQGKIACLAFLDEYLHPENYHYDNLH